jgi:hypothetical protein
VEECGVQDKVKVVQSIDDSVMYANFPLLLNRLFDAMVRGNEEAAGEAFLGILAVVKWSVTPTVLFSLSIIPLPIV